MNRPFGGQTIETLFFRLNKRSPVNKNPEYSADSASHRFTIAHLLPDSSLNLGRTYHLLKLEQAPCRISNRTKKRVRRDAHTPMHNHLIVLR